jgi:hypothetical protein
LLQVAGALLKRSLPLGVWTSTGFDEFFNIEIKVSKGKVTMAEKICTKSSPDQGAAQGPMHLPSRQT